MKQTTQISHANIQGLDQPTSSQTADTPCFLHAQGHALFLLTFLAIPEQLLACSGSPPLNKAKLTCFLTLMQLNCSTSIAATTPTIPNAPIDSPATHLLPCPPPQSLMHHRLTCRHLLLRPPPQSPTNAPQTHLQHICCRARPHKPKSTHSPPAQVRVCDIKADNVPVHGVCKSSLQTLKLVIGKSRFKREPKEAKQRGLGNPVSGRVLLLAKSACKSRLSAGEK